MKALARLAALALFLLVTHGRLPEPPRLLGIRAAGLPLGPPHSAFALGCHTTPTRHLLVL